MTTQLPIEILILTIFNSEIDYLVPYTGNTMTLQVNNHPLVVTLEPLQAIPRQHHNLAQGSLLSLQARLQLFILVAVKTHPQGQNRVVDSILPSIFFILQEGKKK